MNQLEQRLEALKRLRELQLKKQELAQQEILANLASSRYRTLARPSQLPPSQAFWVWLLETGRGFGKTFTGAGWLVEKALTHANSEWAVIAPTFTDVKRVCVEGPSGILKCLRPGELQSYNRSIGLITLVNGARIHMISADEPDRVRGLNLWGAWLDEFAAWRYQETMWHEVLIPALRIGNPQIVITTTPRGSKILRELKARTDGTVVVTHGSIDENAANLSPEALREMHERYDGTRIGRRELMGEDILEVPGALWTMEDIIHENDPQAWKRRVVAIDPAVSNTETSDETGIIVAGKGMDNRLAIIADYSCKDSPRNWAARAIEAFKIHEADCIIVEDNQGGDAWGDIIHSIDQYVPVKKVRARVGKRVRAEPIAALYEQHRVFHVIHRDRQGNDLRHLSKLEDQYLTWDAEDPKSPDRLDAAVHALTELAGISAGSRFLLEIATVCGRCQMPNDKGSTVCRGCNMPLEAEPVENRPINQWNVLNG